MKIHRRLQRYLSDWQYTLKRLWITHLWTKPDNLWAFKVAIAITLMVTPCCIIGQPFWACTLALGAVGAALAESDDHPRGRRKSLAITIASFIIVALSVELLRPYPLLFGLGLAVTSFVLIILGGISPRYQGVTFGALLVSVYAMLGAGIKPWYYQPILLPLGGLMYGSISLILLYLRPYRLLKEQLATAYVHLGQYLELKATLFPCTTNQQNRIRTALAEKNVAIGRSIDATQNVLFACLTALEGEALDGVTPYYNRWMLLQQLHERATSSHQRYDVLSQRSSNKLLVEGLGHLMRELGHNLRNYADTILTGEPFQCSEALGWTESVVGEQLEQSRHDSEFAALSLLYHNLVRLASLLQTTEENLLHKAIPIETLHYKPAPLRQRLRGLLRSEHPRFRHAIRLTLCFVIGFIIYQAFELEKGAWIILTSLFVCQMSYVATRQRLTQRIIGTFSGVVLGVAIAQIMPTTAGQIVMMVASIFCFFYWVRKRYSYGVIFITMFVIAAFNLLVGRGVALMEQRILDTLIGAFLAFAAVRFIWPDWQYRHLPQLVGNAVAQTSHYLRAIYTDGVNLQDYYQYRRAAHQADSALTTAWKGMYVEPKKKRILQRKAYALTYLNHSLLSYVSALGAHHYGKPLTPEHVAVCMQIQRILGQAVSGFSPIGQCSLERITPAEAKQWTRELRHQLENSHDRNLVILYNIAQMSTELLKESTFER
ncbi:MAG: FUSC family membrane protein [Bacteroidales bacterium]|nr:FUSC family membrane protein [Bacteroidales bacterium]